MGKIATNHLGSGNGWSVHDVVCSAGPHDRPFQEQQNWISIAVVVEGSFRFKNQFGASVMSPGSVLLKNDGDGFECSHEHTSGDRCVSIRYSPEFFERAGCKSTFPVHRVPPLRELSPWVVDAHVALHAPGRLSFAEFAHGLADAAVAITEVDRKNERLPTAADERRISTVLRFIAANLTEPLSLSLLAAVAKMSEFHFLRIFRRVTLTTPHQYILRGRLRQSAERLLTRTADISDTAFSVGFGDLSTFNHAFRAEFGATPTEFRARRS